MTISADVEARLLGMRLLTIAADVVVAPARTEVAGELRGGNGRDRAARPLDARRNVSGVGSPVRPLRRPARAARGAGLVAAARAIESGAADLRAARALSP
jgi:hypothetical protein